MGEGRGNLDCEHVASEVMMKTWERKSKKLRDKRVIKDKETKTASKVSEVQ